MKKLVFTLFLIIILTGCSITRVDNKNYVDVMKEIISLNIKNYNKIGKGYKYYAPMGVSRIYSSDYNDILKKGNNKYYLYIDVVSHYYKTPIEYKKNNDLYYSDNISNGKKAGYIQIEEISNSRLYVVMSYNYAKIETYVNKKDLSSAIIDISYILSSVKFNDKILEKMYKSGDFASKDEVYKLFENKEKEGNFLKYIEEFGKYDGTSDDEASIKEVPKTTNN